MKRLFAGRKRSDDEPPEVGNTIDRLVRGKEDVRKKLEEEEKVFRDKKREYVKSLIELESKEVERRERELEEKQTQLAEKKRLNQAVQDKYVEQIKLLQIKFEEVKTEHSSIETELESDIARMEEKLTEVKLSLSERMYEMSEVGELPSAPTATNSRPSTPATSVYPDIAEFTRSLSMTKLGRNSVGNPYDSAGSSPQISISSTGSGHSNSGKNDSDASA